ncbi:MAG: choice-of-anchor J domain-containing protein [Chitinophagaceae bacterium]|nr:choice-of-anchor J domain-containing protein [Chitinophagaceae bacterium]
MKKSTFLPLTVFLLLGFSVFAQQQTTFLSQLQETASGAREKKQPDDQRCGTMSHLEDVYRQNPSLKQANEMLLQQLEQNRGGQQAGSGNRLNAIVTIPIVFHIVLPNPYIISDADIQAQVDRLNLDYSGLNPDSTNGVNFYPVRGHSQIRFCLAQRTPSGQPTNGIERRSSSTTYNASSNDPIKSTAAGGLDVWDFNQYFNVWVGGGGALLGYATFPGTSNASQQGVVTDIIGTSNNPCYVDPNFNMGRTLSHEAGHYFGLFHIWGDDGSACTSSDFRNLPGACVISDATLAGGANDQAIGDTPNQAAPTGGCPSGVRTDACSPSSPGFQYQNYMDYTDDACYSMFTTKQAARMEWVVANCRAGYLTSPGCLPPASGPSLDAAPVAVINPGGSEVGTGCNVITYGNPICPGTITPRIRITNNGLNTMTSVTVGSRIGTGPATTNTITGLSLAAGQTTVVAVPAVTLTIGANALKLFTSDPNGLADGVPANDTVTVNLNIAGPANIPVSQNFDNPSIAPWTIESNGTPPIWQLATPAGAPPSSTSNVTSAVINHYDFDGGGKFDDIRSPIINTTGLTAAQIKFDVAYSPFSATFSDTLIILISKDCGNTYTEVFKKGGTTLATIPGFTTAAPFTPANSGQWRTETINLAASDLTGQLFVVFRSKAGFGNRIWLDNINIANPPFVDMVANSVTRPNAFECASFAPTFTVRNGSNENVNSFKVGYTLDGGTPVIQAVNTVLAPTGTYTASFPAITPSAGSHSIKFFVADPLTASGTLDASRANDTLTRAFTIATTTFPNVVQGFEGAAFAPTNWTLQNPNANITWVRTAPGKTSGFSAFIDNYNNNTVGQLDILAAPPVNTANAESVNITFDVAHRNYDDGSFQAFDRLRVLVSTNCGATFTSVYSKSGPTLATAGASDADFRNPTDAQWRTETIALNNTFTGGSLIVQFENRNDWGNNIFIDNINIAPVFRRDLEVTAVTPDIQCATAYTPSATVRNKGTEAVTAYKVVYRIGTGTPDTTIVTGVNLAPNATATVALTARTLATGANAITAYTIDPVTAGGTGDQYRVNDTLVKTVYSVSTTAAPLVEGFEGSTFIPSGWALSNADASTTWAKSSAGFNSNGSAFMRNFGYLSAGQRDVMYSPVLSFSDVDSVKLTFDLSAATKVAATGTIPMDTLEVLVTRDCGNTFTSVYKKWGTALQTIYDNTPVATEYIPNAYYLWRKETIDLTAYAPNGPLQVVFRNSNNNQNNVFIDNVNVTTRTLPSRLRADGFIVTPSVFAEQFNLWWVQAPSDLRYVTVYNSAGQLLWNRVFGGNGSGSNVITVDLTGKSAGFYIVNLGYSDKSKDQQIRVMKSN